MQTFVRYDRDGAILGVVRVGDDHEGEPFGALGEGESVLEVKEGEAAAKLEPLELHTTFSVDPKRKKLKKGAKQPKPPAPPEEPE